MTIKTEVYLECDIETWPAERVRCGDCYEKEEGDA